MSNLMKDFLGAIFRWALTIVFTWLVSKGVLAADEAEGFVNGFAVELVGWVVVALPLLWSFWQKFRAKQAFEAARATHMNASDDTVAAKMKELGPANMTLW